MLKPEKSAYIQLKNGWLSVENWDMIEPQLEEAGFSYDRTRGYGRRYDLAAIETLRACLGRKKFMHVTDPALWEAGNCGIEISEDDTLWMHWVMKEDFVDEQVDLSKYVFLRKPYFHQKQGFVSCLVNPRFSLMFDMGLGKTYISAAVADWCTLRDPNFKTLIVAPQPILYDWETEISNFTHALEPRVITAKTDIPEQVTENAIITNYELLWRRDFFQKTNFNMVICDESHKLQNPSSKRTKAVLKIGKKSDRVVELTGTPQSNSISDLLGQMLIIDGGRALGSWIGEFRDRFYWRQRVMRIRAGKGYRYFPKYAVKEGAFEEITKRIAPLSLRKEKSDCLDLPDRTFIPHHIRLGIAQMGEYAKMADVLSESKGAEAALMAALNLAKVTSGWKGEKGEEELLKENAKLDFLLELVSNLAAGKKFIVWARFRVDCQIILAAFKKAKIKAVGFFGRSDAESAKSAFLDDPDCRAFVSTIRKGGTGLNLTKATDVFVYSLDTSYRENAQALDRNYRIGQTEKVTCHFLTVHGTVDQAIYENFKTNGELFDRMINSLGSTQEKMHALIYGEGA